jgi:hypothetical protein
MLNLQEPTASASRLLAGYVTETEMAKARGVEKRSLRAERQRGDGPPWLKISNQIFFSEEGFRDWLRSIEQRPVRARKSGSAKRENSDHSVAAG